MNCHAYRTKNTYNIVGNSYKFKERFKEVGGRWDPDKKMWKLPLMKNALDLIRELRIPFKNLYKREAFCHEPEATVCLSEDEVVDGYVSRNFCGNCDSHYGRPVKVILMSEFRESTRRRLHEK